MNGIYYIKIDNKIFRKQMGVSYNQLQNSIQGSWYAISEKEFEIWRKFDIVVPDTNPATGQPWIATQIQGESAGILSPGFDPARLIYLNHLEQLGVIKLQGNTGQFALNISAMSGILTMLFELAIHHKLLNNNQNANVRVVDSIAANYWIESSQINRGAIDHFTTGTKDTLILLFKKLETENTEHLEGQIDKLYFELKEILLEFKSIDVEADLPAELVSILEIVHLSLRPTSTHAEFVTLASEMANAHDGAKK